MVTASIAFDDLARADPVVVARTVSLLRRHPHFPAWKPLIDDQRLAPAEANRRLFALAARWPDDVRGGDDGFDEPAAHFINLPFQPGGLTAPVPAPRSAPDNLLTAYRRNLGVLTGPASDAQKAVALCWIFHLTGDAHQPLHAITLFSDRFPPPAGDRGGTRFYVRAGDDRATVSLHTLWDNLVIGSDRFQAVTNKATTLRYAQGMDRSSLPELTPRFAPGDQEQWVARESHALARHMAYQDGNLVGSQDKTDGAVLPAGYLLAARATATRQVVLAGYRLADVMRFLFAVQPS